MSLSDTALTVNLLTEGERWFDLLKASIREWQGARWEHERERAYYALDLYRRSLDLYKTFLSQLHERAESGYNTELDRRLVNEMEIKLKHWEKKLDEILSGQMAAAGS